MKSNQRIALTKRLLQEALLRIIDKKPLDKISVTELCSEAGINRATFYRHYNIPKDVLLEMEMGFIDQMNARFDIKSIRQGHARYMEELCTYFYDNAELVRVFIRNSTEEDLRKKLDDLFTSFISETDILKRYDMDEESFKLIGTYAAGGGYFMLRRWLMEGINKTPGEIAALVLSFMKNNPMTK